MSKLVFDGSGDRWYQTGIYNTVLYTFGENATEVYDPTQTTSKMTISDYQKGVAWNGVTSITESPQGADITAVYADNLKYLNLTSIEDFKASIEAYTYPDEFAKCDGSYVVLNSGNSKTGLYIPQQSRKKFGLVFKTNLGTDLIDANDPDAPHILHIIYNCRAGVSDRQYQTINDSPEAMTFSWDIETQDDGYMSLATNAANNAPLNLRNAIHLQLRSDQFKTAEDKLNFSILESILFGADAWTAKAYTKGAVVLKTGDGVYVATKASGSTSTTWTASEWTKLFGVSGTGDVNTATLIPSNEVIKIIQNGKLTWNL